MTYHWRMRSLRSLFGLGAALLASSFLWAQERWTPEEIGPERLYFLFVHYGDVESIRRLAKYGVAPNARIGRMGVFFDGHSHESWTALHLAAHLGNIEAIRVLIDVGADPNSRDDWDHATPVFQAVLDGKVDAVEALAAAGADLNTSADRGEHKGDAPIHLAWLDSAMLRTLVSLKADVNKRNGSGETVLHLLAREPRRVEDAKIVLDAGARIDVAAQYESETPLDVVWPGTPLADVLSVYAQRTREGWASTAKLDCSVDGPLLRIRVRNIGKTDEVFDKDLVFPVNVFFLTERGLTVELDREGEETASLRDTAPQRFIRVRPEGTIERVIDLRKPFRQFRCLFPRETLAKCVTANEGAYRLPPTAEARKVLVLYGLGQGFKEGFRWATGRNIADFAVFEGPLSSEIMAIPSSGTGVAP